MADEKTLPNEIWLATDGTFEGYYFDRMHGIDDVRYVRADSTASTPAIPSDLDEAIRRIKEGFNDMGFCLNRGSSAIQADLEIIITAATSSQSLRDELDKETALSESLAKNLRLEMTDNDKLRDENTALRERVKGMEGALASASDCLKDLHGMYLEKGHANELIITNKIGHEIAATISALDLYGDKK